MSITVNGVQKSVSYARGSTPTTIATALAASFHNDGSAPADATSSGAVVTLTARATGATTNYSLSVAASSSNLADFTPASFSAAKSGAAFTGGHDAGVLDTGSVTISANGTNYSTTYGVGDTATSIAGRLASTVNSGAFTYATSSGSTVNVTSKTAGGNSNYSLSSSYTYNSGSFAQPSFTTSGSGATLAGGYDASAIPNHPFITQYQYDTLGNLICVHQKGADSTADKACTDGTVSATWRPRNFTYDSLGRLLTAYNPEAGSMSYQYDNAGNLSSKVEPKPNQLWGSSQTVTVTYAYDALNRLTDKTYSDGTQNSSYRYDYASFLGQSFSHPIGRQVAATAASNTIESFSSYDQMGRVTSTVQCNPSVTGCKTFVASYDKLGDMTSLAYPANGFSVTYGYDSAARPTTATDSSGVIYAQAPTYVASGGMKEFTSPNFNSLKYHVDYNNRLQPTEIWTGTAQGAAALFDKQYSYGTTGSNNGNIYTITNVKDSTRTQTFSYDVLNRLISAQDQTHWANTYTYDAWGNMQKVPIQNVPGENLPVAGDTNNHMQTYAYDAAGNMQSDGSNRYTFDAENRIACMNPDVNWVCNTNSVSYTYDAGSRRVKKSSGTNYWYGPGGNVLAETDNAGVWTNYIFFGGQRLARNVSGDIKYYITDHLHSTAMFVDKAGNTAAILDDNDMYPWGGIVPGVGKTTSTNTVKFTGQYRDTESQLDYFGARYYSNTIGRFMSPDWAAKPTTVPYAKFGDPQSLNLYSYVENGPVNRIDADGHGFVNEAFQDWGMDGNWADGGGDGKPQPQGQTTTRITVISDSNSSKTGGEVSASNQSSATPADMAVGNFVRVGERPLLPPFPADTWYHTYLALPIVEDGQWTGKFNTYGVLGDPGTSDNQQVRSNDVRNGDKPGSDRNHQYDVRVTAAQRNALEKAAIHWTTYECPSCGSHYIRGGPTSARGAYNSNTWVYNMLIHNTAGRIEPPAIVPSPGWSVNDVRNDYYPQ
jgi:RHS repeat-associated protein